MNFTVACDLVIPRYIETREKRDYRYKYEAWDGKSARLCGELPPSFGSCKEIKYKNVRSKHSYGSRMFMFDDGVLKAEPFVWVSGGTLLTYITPPRFLFSSQLIFLLLKPLLSLKLSSSLFHHTVSLS